MLKRFLQIAAALLFFLLSAPTFSHAGSHESKDCFITLANKTVRFSGYQFQGLHPDEAFCHVLPHLGSVIINLEPVSASLSNQQVQLTLARVLNSDDSPVFKKTPLQSFGKQVVTLQTDIQARGLYRLNLQLFEKGKLVGSERFLLLVGIPVTKILVIFSGIAFVFLILITAIAGYKRRHLSV